MNPDLSATASGRDHIIERQMLLWHARRQAARDNIAAESKSGYRFITIAREEGTMGDDVARALSGRLGWHLFDKEIVDCIAANTRVRENLVHELDEKSRGLMTAMILRILRMSEEVTFGEEEYHGALMNTLAYLSTQGEAILVGRGANFALRGETHGLHVRICASSEVRRRRLNTLWQVTEAEAYRRMQDLDSERRKFIRHHYRKDARELRQYDMIFNTDRLSVDFIVESILASFEFSRKPALE